MHCYNSITMAIDGSLPQAFRGEFYTGRTIGISRGEPRCDMRIMTVGSARSLGVHED
jgi:hypothetical protein